MIGPHRLLGAFAAVAAYSVLVFAKGYRLAEMTGRAEALDVQVAVLRDALTRVLNEAEEARQRGARGADAEAVATAALDNLNRQPVEAAHVTPPACPVPRLDLGALRLRDEERARIRDNAAVQRQAVPDDPDA